MPDNNTLSSDIRTGYDSNVAFDIKLDTAKRLDYVFNRTPVVPNIDKVDMSMYEKQVQQPLSTTTANTPTLTINQALLSDDPKLRDVALDTMSKSSSSDPYARLNIGAEIRTPYDQGKKYVNKEFGFDALNADTEDFYYKNSYLDDGWFTRAMKNVLWRFPSRVVVGTATKFLEGLGYVGSMVTNGVIDGAKALAGKETHYWEDVADNTFSKIMQNANQNFRDYVVPVYKEAGFDQKGFFSQLTNYSFWNDSMADGVSFMASAFIPAGIASKIGLLGKGVGLAAEVGEEAGLLSRAGGLLRTGIRAATGAETYGEAGLSIFNTANEAAFEATGNYTQTKQDLLDARARGENNYSDNQIKDMAGKAAASTFGWNFPALMISNAWEMKNIIKPIAGRASNATINGSERLALKETGEVGFKPFTKGFVGSLKKSYLGQVARAYVPIAVEGTLIEGWWEENIQNAIQRGTAGSYVRYGDDTGSKGVIEKADNGFLGILGQFAKQSWQTLKGNDRENSLSVGLGGLMGILGGVGGAKFGARINPVTGKTSFVLGERRQQNLETNLAIAETNNAYNNFLSIQDVKNKDGTIDEKKLAAKVASFESFAAKQELLDDLKTKKTYAPEELDMLQNKLLNDYVKGLVKVGKLDDAVTRVQQLASRNVEAKGEKFISDPQQVAQYMKQVSEDYKEIQSRPDQRSAKYAPQQMEQINTAIKDRAFDLVAERRAIQPVLKNYEKQVSDKFASILDFLQNNEKLPQGEFIEQGLARSRARDYIDAMAKKEVFSGIAKQANPSFVKEYLQGKIKEADNAIASYNKELGQNAPEIKDGVLTFKDETIDFNSKLLNSLLTGYKNAYSDQADLEFSQQYNEFISKAITDPEKGLDNWNDYLTHIQNLLIKKNLPTQQPVEDKEKGILSFLSGLMNSQGLDNYEGAREYVKDKLGLPVDKDNINLKDIKEKANARIAELLPPTQEPDFIDEAGQNTEETGQGTETQTADEDKGDVTEDEVVTDEKKAGKVPRDDISPESSLSWYTPNKTSTDDTKEINKETEQLQDVPYDEARKAVLKKAIVDPTVNEKFKFYIVKDNFQDIYKPPANNKNPEEIEPAGEVIAMFKADGTNATINDILPGKFKDIGDLPVVFSFEDKIFRNYLVENRATIWADKMKKTVNDAHSFYEKENNNNKKARNIIKNNPEAKIQVEVIDATDGIMPTEKVVPVIQRFGENFEVSVRTVDSKSFSAGTIVATIGKAVFPVGTARLGSNAAELINLQKILEKKFDNFEDANQVRNQYLNTMFYTDENQRFRIKTNEDGSRQIYFAKVSDKDRGLSKEQKKVAAKESIEYDKLRFNVSKTALKEGMNRYNPDTGVFDAITPEQYQAFIKTKVVTSLKKTLDKDGNLYMKPVNAYFSFKIVDDRFKEVDTAKVQADNFAKIGLNIAEVIDSQVLTQKVLEGEKKKLTGYLKKNQISQEQFNQLNARLTQLQQGLKAKPKEEVKVTPKEEVKTATKLEEKTEVQEDEEEKKAKETKAKLKGKKKADVNEVVGNVPAKTTAGTPYTVAVGNDNYVMDKNTGYIRKQLTFGSTNRYQILQNSDKTFPTVLDAMANAYPFQQAEDGTISGIMKTQLEGKDQTFTAYGLPVLVGNNVFVDASKKVIVAKDAEGLEVSPVPVVKTMLTDNGQKQLEEFLQRNCK